MSQGAAPATRSGFGALPASAWASAGLAVAIGTAAAFAGARPILAAAALIVMAVPAVWVLSSPTRALLLYAFILPIDVYLSTTLRVTSTQVLQVAIFAGWMVRLLLTPRAPAARRPATVLPYGLGAALVGYLVVSLTWTIDFDASIRNVARMLGAMLMAVYAAEHADRVQIGRFARAMCYGALVITIYGFAQYARGGYDPLYQFFSPVYTDPFMARGGGFAAVATFANPNILAGYLLMVMPLAWAGVIDGPRGSRVGWAVASLLMAGVLLLTFSKGSWLLLGALAALWIVGRLPIGTTLSAVAMAGIVLGMVLFYLDPIVRGLLYLFPDSRQASVDTRLALWWAAVNVFLERPLLGFGPDGFAAATASMREGAVADLTRAHNMYLQALVDYGIVGSVLLWSTCAVILRRGWMAVGAPRPRIESARHLGLFIGAVGFFLHGFFETMHGSNQYMNTQWLIFGLLAASTRNAGPQRGAHG